MFSPAKRTRLARTLLLWDEDAFDREYLVVRVTGRPVSAAVGDLELAGLPDRAVARHCGTGRERIRSRLHRAGAAGRGVGRRDAIERHREGTRHDRRRLRVSGVGVELVRKIGYLEG